MASSTTWTVEGFPLESIVCYSASDWQLPAPSSTGGINEPGAEETEMDKSSVFQPVVLEGSACATWGLTLLDIRIYNYM